MSSLAKQRQSWLDLVSQAGPTVTENPVSFAQVHTQGNTVQKAPCSELAAALAWDLWTTGQTPLHSGEKLITHNPSKHKQFLQVTSAFMFEN